MPSLEYSTGVAWRTPPSPVVISIGNIGGQNILVTKKEVDDLLEVFIEAKVNEWFENTFFAMQAEIKSKINAKMLEMEEHSKNYLSTTYTKSVNTIVDGMMNYRFEQEVKSRVAKELEKRGKF